MGTLDGKVALITGSGRGIGRAIATKLALNGAHVVINDIDEAPAEETARALREAGAKAVTCVGDVTKPDFGDRIVGTGLREYGGLDIIVNNAGYTWDTLIHKMTDEQFQAMFDVHAFAPFRILRAASEPIREFAKKEAAEGREVIRKVVNVSSIVGMTGNPGQVNYAAAKAALNGITWTLNKEWGRYKVTVNSVAFAAIETRISQAVTGDKPVVKVGDREVKIGIPAGMVEASKALIPLGRWGTPEEGAGAVYLFCIPESDFISGQVILASGGMLV